MEIAAYSKCHACVEIWAKIKFHRSKNYLQDNYMTLKIMMTSQKVFEGAHQSSVCFRQAFLVFLIQKYRISIKFSWWKAKRFCVSPNSPTIYVSSPSDGKYCVSFLQRSTLCTFCLLHTFSFSVKPLRVFFFSAAATCANCCCKKSSRYVSENIA